MSDSFAQLWNSSTPQKPQQSLSSLAAQQQQQQRRPQGPDLFTLLASSSAAPAQRPLQPSQPQKLQNPQKPQKQPQQDAFSDLFSSSSQSSNQNLTIAQRAALADKQRQESPQVHVEKDSSPWVGLDSLGAGFGGLVPTPIASSSNTSLGDNSNSSRPSSQSKTKLLPPDDDWGLGDLSAPQRDPAPRESSLWDLDEFASHSTTLKDTSPKQHTESRVDSPSNVFDFGNREDGLLSKNQGDDDFMSVFNNPPQPKQPALPPRPTNHSSTPSPSSLPRSTSRSSSSPPPHVLGQIVEMGFPIPQARAALAANNNDVQAALNQLLASEGGHSSNGRGTPNSQSRGSPAPALSAISSQQQPALPRRRDREILREREQQASTPSPVSTSAGVQAQAEQLLAQATVMGRGMFTKASSFLKEKSAQVQKAVEEHRSPSGAGGSGGGVNGKPRWAQGSGVEERGFRDSDEPLNGVKDSEAEPEVRIPRRVDRQRTRERVKEPVAAPIQEPEIDLFAPSEPNTSLPPLFDVQTSATPPLPTRPRQRQQRQRSPTSQPSPPKFQRNTTAISHSITSLKSDANAAFKLGQFADAENLYTRAIESLGRSSDNDNSIYYVLLLNNRANARMKIGDVNGAVKDCEAVVGIVTTDRVKLPDEFDALGTGGGLTKSSAMGGVRIDWEPAYDTALGKIQMPISNGSSELVDLGEGLVKAIKRRADAYEGMEKWGQAKKDWEWLRSTSWVRDNMRGEAGRGVERCIRMVGGGKDANGSSTTNGFSSSPPSSSRQSLPSTKRKPVPKIIPSRNTKQSEALQNLRSTTAQAEAEDQAKYELKDTVDSKLSAWKNGKETNIRALLASLDLVLWEEMLNSGGSSVKVGMHEVVTPAQVKIKYMKAVARVHPDKLNANNSTVEQRMVAQGVFGALNEAWNAFKQ